MYEQYQGPPFQMLVVALQLPHRNLSEPSEIFHRPLPHLVHVLPLHGGMTPSSMSASLAAASLSALSNTSWGSVSRRRSNRFWEARPGDTVLV